MNQSKRFLELDGIRGLAALAIVLFHYAGSYQWSPHNLYYYFSYLEEFVQLFFIISGFVILISFQRINNSIDFIMGRVFRLYPAYWFSVITTIVIAYISQRPLRSDNLYDILINFSMFQEMVGSRNINIVYWTMTLELAFYTIILILYQSRLLKYIDIICGIWLILIVFDIFRAYQSPELSLTIIGNLPSNQALVYPDIVGLFKWDNLSEFISFIRNYIKFNFILLRGRAPLFIAGLILYQCQVNSVTIYRVFLIVACVLARALDYSPGTPKYAFIFFAIFVVILYLAHREKLRFVSTRILVFLGGISYSLYLTHIQSSWLFNWSLQSLDIPPELSVIVRTIFAILVAYIVTIAIEKPALRFFRNQFKRNKSTS
ncbi:MAG: acyltransferase [Limnospira sp. PMC 1291.21]|uniref:Lipopolysaccharide biosynthesis acyltransferase (Acyltransferase 3) n=2 Tax=Limnospira TaxID=2596745 RepID=A0A9P1KF54_9CYAN|nr:MULTISPECIES: acyltransferase [Limnospira]MDC0840464.1 acyltransferase [Limnoraphis robusta]QJB26741.1 acyltransferase [Limnospira fusiformis SAG 85.79]EDZ94883.1 acyltransferase 3 [Limnospira maxima CS-328]MDT9177624.1 acyltransferase [Limnospira sp. PMC 1238.20]MDT9193006.1 acyltransferase [Limnospira sp. PMC 1245.20]